MACCWTGSTNFPCGTAAACDVGPVIRTSKARRRVYHAVPIKQVMDTGLHSSAYQAMNNNLTNTAIQWHTQRDACSYTTAAPEASIVLEDLQLQRQQKHKDAVPNFILTPPAIHTTSATTRPRQSQQHAVTYENQTSMCVPLGTTGAELQGVSKVEHAQCRSSRRSVKHKQTHPAVITRAIKSCKTPSQLSSIVKLHRLQPEYNVVHASAALTHLAQLSTRMPEPPSPATRMRQHRQLNTSAYQQVPAAWDSSARLAEALLCDVLERRACLQPRQLSNVCWAIAKLQSMQRLPETLTLTHELQSRLEQGITTASDVEKQEEGAGQVITRQSHTAVDVQTPIAWLAHAAGEQWAAFNPQELSSLAYSLAQLGQPPPCPSWLAGLLQHACSILPQMTPQGIANILWAVSHWIRFTQPLNYHEQGQDLPVNSHGCWQVLNSRGCWQSCDMIHTDEASQAQTHAVQAGIEGLLQKVWDVTAAQLCVTPSSHEHTSQVGQQSCPRQPWTAGSLAVVAWSLATMRVVPPTGWLSTWYQATFPLLTSLSAQDACYVSWAVARWRQLHCWGVQGRLPDESAHTETLSSQHTKASRQQCFHMPTAWHSRLSGRVSELLMQISASGPGNNTLSPMHDEFAAGSAQRIPPTATQSCDSIGSPALLHVHQLHDVKPIQQLLRPVADMGTSSTVQQQDTASSQPSLSCDTSDHSGNATHQHGHIHHLSVSMLLWSAGALKLRLPTSCRNNLMADMILHAPRGKYSARDFLELLSLEISWADGRSTNHNTQVHASTGKHIQQLGALPGKQQPSTMKHASSISAQQDHADQVSGQPCSPPSNNRTERGQATQTAECIPTEGNTVRQSLYQLAWSAAHRLIHSKHDVADDESNRSRVRLMQLVAQLPGVYMPTCRAAWRAARAVLPKIKKGTRVREAVSSMPYTEQQAAQLLSALAHKGYRADPSEVCMLLFKALSTPLTSSCQSHQADAQAAMQLLQLMSDVAWSAARLARLSTPHRYSLACNKQVTSLWRNVQSHMLAVTEQHLNRSSNGDQLDNSTHHQQVILISNTVPLFLWSLADLTAAAVTQGIKCNSSQHPAAGSHPLQTTDTALASGKSQEGYNATTLAPLLKEPSLAIWRGKQQSGSPDVMNMSVCCEDSRTMHATCEHVQPGVNQQGSHRQEAASTSPPKVAAGQWLVPLSDLLRWLTVVDFLIPSLAGRPLLLLLSWLVRLPADMKKQPEVHARLAGLLPPLIDRSLAVLSHLSCGELATLAAHMAWLITRITNERAGDGYLTDSPVGFDGVHSCIISQKDKAANSTCSLVSLDRVDFAASIFKLTTALEFAGEVKSAEMHRNEASKLAVALAKLRSLQA